MKKMMSAAASAILAFMQRELINSEAGLRALYAQPIERARLKVLARLDTHCRKFIDLSPFVCLATCGPRGADVAPRGDEPGFVHVLADTMLAIPDWRGNNRLDSLSNIVANPEVALLFFIPGVQETLRVNGTCEISTSSELLCRWERNGNRPKTALVITVREAFLHCGKALIRSRLWQEDYKIERAALPSYGQMLKDQTEVTDSAEQIQASVEHGYANNLY
jgi:PPOX class probable FMN-dependent enzyme